MLNLKEPREPMYEDHVVEGRVYLRGGISKVVQASCPLGARLSLPGLRSAVLTAFPEGTVAAANFKQTPTGGGGDEDDGDEEMTTVSTVAAFATGSAPKATQDADRICAPLTADGICAPLAATAVSAPEGAAEVKGTQLVERASSSSMQIASTDDTRIIKDVQTSIGSTTVTEKRKTPSPLPIDGALEEYPWQPRRRVASDNKEEVVILFGDTTTTPRVTREDLREAQTPSSESKSKSPASIAEGVPPAPQPPRLFLRISAATDSNGSRPPAHLYPSDAVYESTTSPEALPPLPVELAAYLSAARRLGYGGEGQVFEGPRGTVLKVVPRVARHDGRRYRMDGLVGREARVLEHLSKGPSAFFVPTYRGLYTHGTSSLVLEMDMLPEGALSLTDENEDLLDALDANGALLASAAASAASGLRAIHAAGVTHNDLKPETANMLIERIGDGGSEARAWFIDFGKACFEEEGSSGMGGMEGRGGPCGPVPRISFEERKQRDIENVAASLGISVDEFILF